MKRLSLITLVLTMLFLVQCVPPELTAAKVYMREDNFEMAEEQLLKAKEKYPDNAEVYFRLAQIEKQRGNHLAASKYFDKVEELGGEFSTSVPLKSDFQYQKIQKLNTTKDTIFIKAKDWLAETYTDSKEVIKLEDRDRGKIIGKGLYRKIYYTIIIEIKDEKARLTFKDFQSVDKDWVPKYKKEPLKQHFEYISKDFKESINKEDQSW